MTASVCLSAVVEGAGRGGRRCRAEAGVLRDWCRGGWPGGYDGRGGWCCQSGDGRDDPARSAVAPGSLWPGDRGCSPGRRQGRKTWPSPEPTL